MLTSTFLKHWISRLFTPGETVQATYKGFHDLLAFDGRCHELMAEFEALYYQGKKEDLCKINHRFAELSQAVLGMVQSLNAMAPGTNSSLLAYYKKFDFYSRFLLAPPTTQFTPPFTCDLVGDDCASERIGGKGKNLIGLASNLHLIIPAGFAIPTNSFHLLIEYNHLRSKINKLLTLIDLDKPEDLVAISQELTDLINNGHIPPRVIDSIHESADLLLASCLTSAPQFAVRSSAVNEDGACSFAGQYKTLLNVEPSDILKAYLAVLAGKYSPEALTYRIHTGLSDEETAMAVLVLEMVDANYSGVVYTSDPSGVKKDTGFIHFVKGLAEPLVSGRVIPQVIEVQDGRLVDKNDHLDDELDESTLLALQELARQAQKITDFHGVPQDIEWSLANDGRLVFLQSRPLAIQEEKAVLQDILPSTLEPFFTAGVMASSGMASGKAYRFDDSTHTGSDLPVGAILVLKETLPSYVTILSKVKGVIAELGSPAGHLATVCRELNIPMLLGVGDVLQQIQHGQTISLFADHHQVFVGDHVPSHPPVPMYVQQKELPFFKRLKSVLGFITPLKLIDPQHENFKPESCRSFHDIIRFSHEESIRIMFAIGERMEGRKGKSKKLRSDLPLDLFFLDVGGGLELQDMKQIDIDIHQVSSLPFRAIWQGLTHPMVEWDDRSHFDWQAFDDIALAGGVASKDSSDFASYAIVGREYLNLNMRFGYHFTLVDVLCGEDASQNYCQFRFAGGGGEFAGRILRMEYVSTILKRIGFQVVVKGDLLDSRCQQLNQQEILERLRLLGRLLGISKLLDMRLQDEAMVATKVQEFFNV